MEQGVWSRVMGQGQGAWSRATRGARPKLLLLSFDGFRWDYVDRVPTPNFHALMKEGSIVEQVENAYITKTFPDHYTLVTGLHAETHGIVGNEMYDPDLNASFSMETHSAYEPRWWAGAEPLWVTNQKQGGRSGGVMWPGSDVEIGGAYPSRYLPYNASLSFERRVETMVAWLMGEGPGDGVRSVQGGVDFGVLYWEEPDESGHSLGPENPLMDAVIADIDDKLGFLRNELRKKGLYLLSMVFEPLSIKKISGSQGAPNLSFNQSIRVQTLHHGQDQRALQRCQGQDCRPTQGWNGLQDHRQAAW
uniref:Ectonucleotide pyrophosphatase/phosphodiesterase 5 n=1 Tax=Hucho hucho TaxID=62062 RepID=A0A4W5LVY3_9TELE